MPQTSILRREVASSAASLAIKPSTLRRRPAEDGLQNLAPIVVRAGLDWSSGGFRDGYLTMLAGAPAYGPKRTATPWRRRRSPGCRGGTVRNRQAHSAGPLPPRSQK